MFRVCEAGLVVEDEYPATQATQPVGSQVRQGCCPCCGGVLRLHGGGVGGSLLFFAFLVCLAVLLPFVRGVPHVVAMSF